MGSDERVNMGYRIINSVMVYGAEFVVGYNSNAADRYVCWRCFDGGNYENGHYCKSEFSAINKMLDRAKEYCYMADNYRAHRNRSISEVPYEERQNKKSTAKCQTPEKGER